MTALRHLFLGALAAGLAATAADERLGRTELDEEVEVIHAERMIYPLAARVHAAQGAVLIKVEVEKTGKVRSAWVQVSELW